MLIRFSPQAYPTTPPRFDYEVVAPEVLRVTDLSGPAPVVLGDFDFSPLLESQMLPIGSEGEWFREAARIGGVVEVTVLLPQRPSDDAACCFPAPVTVNSGRVPLPTDGV